MEWQIIEARLNALLKADRKSELRGALTMLNPVDVAQYLSTLDTEKLLFVFRILPRDVSADVFSYMDDSQREKLVSSIGDHEIGALIEEMFLDDAVDFLEEMPVELVRRVLANVSEEQRKLINRFLSYPENSVGSIMTIEYCAFPLGFTVREVMQGIRRTGVDKETVNTIYLVDGAGVLKGTVPLRKLIMADDEAPAESVMVSNFVSVGTLDDQEIAAALVRKYDLLALPVTDQAGRLVGIVTVDDVMDVVQDEATEDMEKMSALTPSDSAYMETGVWKLAGNRLPWLVLMLAGSVLAGLVIDRYSALITGIGLAITACIPMLMDTGGNCGQQASTLVIRALALGEITPRDALRVVWKELRVALMLSVVLCAVNFFIQWLITGTLLVAAVASAAMFLTVLIAKTVGALLPLGAKALKLDPALTASPLITTAVDIASLLLLFETAAIFLSHQ